ncbi:MAG: exodeoxyribonuclease VII small subunit [Proteobacteria bacterium]|nr:exodeoxyribonuclease VII small subunit [Pseudomonadota bacterium]
MVERRSFEQAMGDLEGVVKRLEGGELTLDESLAAFEKGIKLARECEAGLAEAKGKIEQLIRNSQGDIKAAPLDVK